MILEEKKDDIFLAPLQQYKNKILHNSKLQTLLQWLASNPLQLNNGNSFIIDEIQAFARQIVIHYFSYMKHVTSLMIFSKIKDDMNNNVISGRQKTSDNKWGVGSIISTEPCNLYYTKNC